MKKFYKIFLGILAIGAVSGTIGSYMMSRAGSDVGTTLFFIGALLVPTSIVGIRIYYIKSDPVRFVKFKQNQEQKRREKARRATIYHDEKLREKARLDARDERRGW